MGGKILHFPGGNERKPGPSTQNPSIGYPDWARPLLGVIGEYNREQTHQMARLAQAEKAIFEIYSSLAPDQRALFFSMVYNRFSEYYDRFMGIETRHYRAIKRVMQFAMPYLREPMLDITAGTGEPLKYAMGFMERGNDLGPEFDMIKPPEDSEGGGFLANEISPKMREIAQKKLADGEADFSDFDAFSLPDELRGRFRTVLCSQTFHLISEEDKTRLSISIRDALMSGGTAVVMEEDPFRISQAGAIEVVSLFLRSVAVPIKPEMIVGRLEATGLHSLEDTAASPIDEHHVMRLHLFQK
ncbi:MAG: class I SAM-dependent methyltransferase [Candidatus Micrarchaeota archaeon]